MTFDFTAKDHLPGFLVPTKLLFELGAFLPSIGHNGDDPATMAHNMEEGPRRRAISATHRHSDEEVKEVEVA